jgi:DNA-binding Xre family transcriptional regulator
MRRARLKIKEVAEQRHVSMRQLHLRSEIALSRMKKFYRNPYIDIKLGTLMRIADVLDCDVCELFETEETEKP